MAKARVPPDPTGYNGAIEGATNANLITGLSDPTELALSVDGTALFVAKSFGTVG